MKTFVYFENITVYFPLHVSGTSLCSLLAMTGAHCLPRRWVGRYGNCYLLFFFSFHDFIISGTFDWGSSCHPVESKPSKCHPVDFKKSPCPMSLYYYAACQKGPKKVMSRCQA